MVTTLEPVEALVVPRAEFAALLERHPRIALAILRTQVDRQRLDPRGRLRDEPRRPGGHPVALARGARPGPAATHLLVAADDVAPLHQRDARLRLRTEIGVDHRIRDPVADLVRMTFGDGFTREKIARTPHG